MKIKRTPSTLLSEVKLFSIFQQSGNFRLKRREHWVRLKSHSNPSEPEILLKSHFSLILNSHRILSVLQVHRYSPSIFASLTFLRHWSLGSGASDYEGYDEAEYGGGAQDYGAGGAQDYPGTECVLYKYVYDMIQVCWSNGAMAILALKKQQTGLHNVWLVWGFESCKRPRPWKRIVLRPWTMTQ